MDRTFIPSDYLPVLVQSLVAFGFVAVTMFATHFIGRIIAILFFNILI